METLCCSKTRWQREKPTATCSQNIVHVCVCVCVCVCARVRARVCVPIKDVKMREAFSGRFNKKKMAGRESFFVPRVHRAWQAGGKDAAAPAGERAYNHHITKWYTNLDRIFSSKFSGIDGTPAQPIVTICSTLSGKRSAYVTARYPPILCPTCMVTGCAVRGEGRARSAQVEQADVHGSGGGGGGGGV
jgi:hypothetical protein